MRIRPRTEWQLPSQPVTGPAGDLSKIEGIVIHYPGVPAGALNLADPVKVLRDTQRYYLTRQPVTSQYSIGYNFAAFPDSAWELRGFDIRSAATKGANATTLAILVVQNGDLPADPGTVEHVRFLVAEIRAKVGRFLPLTPHHAHVPTSCPGKGIGAQLSAGLLEPVDPPPLPPVPPEDAMQVRVISCPTARVPAQYVAMPDLTKRWINRDRHGGKTAMMNWLRAFGYEVIDSGDVDETTMARLGPIVGPRPSGTDEYGV